MQNFQDLQLLFLHILQAIHSYHLLQQYYPALPGSSNYLKDKRTGIEAYKAGLSLGYTQPISEIYRKAGISFDFSSENIKNLAGFVSERLKQN